MTADYIAIFKEFTSAALFEIGKVVKIIKNFVTPVTRFLFTFNGCKIITFKLNHQTVHEPDPVKKIIRQKTY